MDTVTKAVDAVTISSTKDDSARTVKIAQRILNASNLQYDGNPRMEIRNKKRDSNEEYADYKQCVSITVHTIEFVFIIVRKRHESEYELPSPVAKSEHVFTFQRKEWKK